MCVILFHAELFRVVLEFCDRLFAKFTFFMCLQQHLSYTHKHTVHPHTCTGFYQVARKQKTLTVDEVTAKSPTLIFFKHSVVQAVYDHCTVHNAHTGWIILPQLQYLRKK